MMQKPLKIRPPCHTLRKKVEPKWLHPWSHFMVRNSFRFQISLIHPKKNPIKDNCFWVSCISGTLKNLY